MIYVYSIANDFPGGQFTSAISDRLNSLIKAQIATPLIGVNSDGTSVSIEFQNALTPAEKTILDGDTSKPAGGLIAKSTESFEVKIGSTVMLTGDVFQIASSGIFSVTVSLQYKDGYGNNMSGSGAVKIGTIGLTPTNASGNKVVFDGSGAASFIVGPTTDRGKLEIALTSGSLPERVFTVEFI